MATLSFEKLNEISVSTSSNRGEEKAFSIDKEYFVLFTGVDWPGVSVRIDLFKSPLGSIDIEHLDNTTIVIHAVGEPQTVSDQVGYEGNFYPLGDGRFVYYQTGSGLDSVVAFIIFDIENDTINIRTPLTFYTFARRLDDGNPSPSDPVMFVLDSNTIAFTTVIGSSLFTNATRNLYFQAVKVNISTDTPSFGTEIKHTVGTHRSFRAVGTGANLDASRVMFETGFTNGSSSTPTKRFIIWNHVANTVSWTDTITTGGWLTQSGGNHYYKLSNGKNYVLGGNRPSGSISYDRYWLTFNAPTTLTRSNVYDNSWFNFTGHNFTDDYIAHFRGVYDGSGYPDFRLDIYDGDGNTLHDVHLDIGDPDNWNDSAYAFLDVDKHILFARPNNSTALVKLYSELILPSFVKKFDTQTTLDIFAGSISEDGDIDGAALLARFGDLESIAATTDGTQRRLENESWNRFYALDQSKIRLIHPCDEPIEQTVVLFSYNSDDWKYYTGTTGVHPGFESTTYDDSSWNTGLAPFGDTCLVTARTNWPTFDGSELVLRKWLGPLFGTVKLYFLLDDNMKVYWNGVNIYSESTSVTRGYGFQVTVTVPRNLLSTSNNLLAVRVHDVGLGCNGFAVHVENTTPW